METNKESIFDKDKLQHFVVCFITSIVSPALAIGLALGKEYGDSKAHGNHWCWLDILADSIGITLGTFIHVLILLMII